MSLFELSERLGAVIDFTAFLISAGSSLLEIFSCKEKAILNQDKQIQCFEV